MATVSWLATLYHHLRLGERETMETSTKVYIAGYFDTRERLLPHREALRRLGYQVTSQWLDEVHATPLPFTPQTTEDIERKFHLDSDMLLKFAIRDLRDISLADVLIVDTFDVTPRGGREVEFGLAYAWGKKLYVVGPERNVFHKLALRHFETWDAALQYFAQGVEE